MVAHGAVAPVLHRHPLVSRDHARRRVEAGLDGVVRPQLPVVGSRPPGGVAGARRERPADHVRHRDVVTDRTGRPAVRGLRGRRAGPGLRRGGSAPAEQEERREAPGGDDGQGGTRDGRRAAHRVSWAEVGVAARIPRAGSRASAPRPSGRGAEQRYNGRWPVATPGPRAGGPGCPVGGEPGRAIFGSMPGRATDRPRRLFIPEESFECPDDRSTTALSARPSAPRASRLRRSSCRP